MRLLALVIFVMVSVAANAQTFPQTFPPGVFPTRITPLIFNGTDLAGWKVEYTKADVLDGAVHVGSGNGWVRTEGAYADFLLTMDVKLDPKAQAGNLRQSLADVQRQAKPDKRVPADAQTEGNVR